MVSTVLYHIVDPPLLPTKPLDLQELHKLFKDIANGNCTPFFQLCLTLLGLQHLCWHALVVCFVKCETMGLGEGYGPSSHGVY